MQCTMEDTENLWGTTAVQSIRLDSPPQVMLDGAASHGMNEMNGVRGHRETPLTLHNVMPTPEPMNGKIRDKIRQGKDHQLFPACDSSPL